MPPEAIYTDDIKTTVPDAPIIPTDIEEIGTRVVMLELEIRRIRAIIEGLIVVAECHQARFKEATE